MFYDILFGRLKTVDREITARCIAIMNRADPELITDMQYVIGQVDANKSDTYIPFGSLIAQNRPEWRFEPEARARRELGATSDRYNYAPFTPLPPTLMYMTEFESQPNMFGSCQLQDPLLSSSSSAFRTLCGVRRPSLMREAKSSFHL